MFYKNARAPGPSHFSRAMFPTIVRVCVPRPTGCRGEDYLFADFIGPKRLTHHLIMKNFFDNALFPDGKTRAFYHCFHGKKDQLKYSYHVAGPSGFREVSRNATVSFEELFEDACTHAVAVMPPGAPHALVFIQLFHTDWVPVVQLKHAWERYKNSWGVPELEVCTDPAEPLCLPDRELTSQEITRVAEYLEDQRKSRYQRFCAVHKQKMEDPALNPTKAATTPCTSEMFYDLFFSKEGTTIYNGDLGFAALREAGFKCERIPAIMRPCSGSWVPATDDDIADNYYFCVVKHNVWL